MSNVLLPEGHFLNQQGKRAQMLDFSVGGQFGVMPDNVNWESSAAYVKQNVIPFLISAPKLIQYLPNSATVYAMLKGLVETMPSTIEGLNATPEWSYSENPVGNSGSMFHTPTGSKITPSEPVHQYYERKGNSIFRFLNELQRLFVMDPYLQKPGIISFPKYIQAGAPAILPADQSMTVLYVEPDETMTRVINAYLICNMMVKSGLEMTSGKKSGGEENEVPQLSITYTGYQLFNTSGVTLLANTILDTISKPDLRPIDLQPFMNKIAEEVSAVDTTGFVERIKDMVTPTATKF